MWCHVNCANGNAWHPARPPSWPLAVLVVLGGPPGLLLLLLLAITARAVVMWNVFSKSCLLLTAVAYCLVSNSFHVSSVCVGVVRIDCTTSGWVAIVWYIRKTCVSDWQDMCYYNILNIIWRIGIILLMAAKYFRRMSLCMLLTQPKFWDVFTCPNPKTIWPTGFEIICWTWCGPKSIWRARIVLTIGNICAEIISGGYVQTQLR